MNKKDFPILQRKINGRKIVYLDSASTSQKPKSVISAVVNFYQKNNANVHRGIYPISEEATTLFEQARRKVAKFIKAQDSAEIIFTKNATESLNILANGLSQNLKKGDAILISEMEHHSNLVPWQRVAKEKGAKLFFLKINDKGLLTNEIVDYFDTVQYHSIKEIPNLKIVSLTHVSNVLGTINPIKDIISKIHPRGVQLATSGVALDDSPEVKRPIIIIDAAQSVPHMRVDVQKLGCDFLVFSGHKMLGPTGVGVLWGKKKLLEKMEPFSVGSQMIKEVTKEKATWNDLPWKFESGTPALEAVIGLGAAIDYLEKIGMEKISEHEKKLVSYCLSRMEKVDGLTIYGPRLHDQYTGISGIKRSGVISFNINGVHAHDVAQVLGDEGICIRAGHHCAMPLHQRLGVPATCRVSFYLYNDKKDVDKLIEGIKKVKSLFRFNGSNH